MGRAEAVLTLTVLAWLGAVSATGDADVLEVGPGRRLGRIEEANARAREGDVILVHPPGGGLAYEQVAVFVTRPRLTFRGAATAGKKVQLSGKGFDYSGRGRIPRAIFQFNRGADGCVLEGFELFGAHNDSHNGAGVRINQANNVVVRNCEIHHNDMGIMSNGDGTLTSARNQLIDRCILRDNGDVTRPGYNHNLYLGGTSVFLVGCEVSGALTGHNVKSRAHFSWVESCYVHHSANREFDLVDADETAFPESHAVLIGNVIVKAPNCKGNRAVIHFGTEGGKEHNGTLHLVNNTVVTPFRSPVVDLSSAGAKANLVNNIICDGAGGGQGQVLVAASRGGADVRNASGSHNLFSVGFAPLPAGFAPGTNLVRPGKLPFVNPDGHDYRLSRPDRAFVDAGLVWSKIRLPSVVAWPFKKTPQERLSTMEQYRHPASTEPRKDPALPDLGAYAYTPKP